MTATNTTTAKTTAAKTPNYSPEQEKTLETGYKAGREAKQDNKTIVAALAAATGKNTRSIVAKLNRMGLYAKDAYVSKTGEKPVKKDDLADKIGVVLHMNEAETTSLTNCSKDALKKVFEVVQTVTGEDGTVQTAARKAELVQSIGNILKFDAAEMKSLGYVNKSVLQKLFTVLAQSKPIDGTDTAKVMASPEGWAAIEGDAQKTDTGEPQDGDGDAGEPDDTDNENDDKGENE